MLSITLALMHTSTRLTPKALTAPSLPWLALIADRASRLRETPQVSTTADVLSPQADQRCWPFLLEPRPRHTAGGLPVHTIPLVFHVSVRAFSKRDMLLSSSKDPGNSLSNQRTASSSPPPQRSNYCVAFKISRGLRSGATANCIFTPPLRNLGCVWKNDTTRDQI